MTLPLIQAGGGGGGGGSVRWDQILSATSPLTLSNVGNATTFNQTSAVTWTWANTTAAVVGTSQSSPILTLSGTYWTGSVSGTDNWNIQVVESNGANATSELTFTHTAGTTGPNYVTIPAVTITSTPQGGLGFNGTKAASATYNALFGAIGTATFALVPSCSTAVNQSCDLRWYTCSASATPAVTWSAVAASNNGGAADLTIQAQINSNGQGINLHCAVGTTARTGILLGGDGGNNGKNFAATAGTQVGVSCGNGGAATPGSLTFNPASGNASFVGLQVNPTINVTGSASGGSYTSLKVNTVETSLTGMAGNLFLDMQGGASGGTSRYSVNSSGIVSNYNTEATAAVGEPYIRAVTLRRSETGADANLLTFTPASVAATYRVTIVMSVSANNTATLGWTLAWTDSNGAAQTPVNMALFKQATGGSALTFSAAAGNNFYATCIIDVNNSGTNIVVKTTFSGTSITYLATAIIERLS